MNGAQALFKALVDAGLDTCFANPGTSEMQLVYEIGLTKGVRAVLCLQENTVTGAADGYARMMGRPAFTLLHVGSGLANGLANIHNASRSNTPMVNVVGANATYHQPNFAEHEFINGNITDIARVVSHWAHQAKSASDLGYENMAWKDSGDSVMYPDGKLVSGPKALCELQGYVYDAWLRMAEIYDELGNKRRANGLRKKAAALFKKFNEEFWDEESGFYAYALDGEKKRVLSVASNLWSGIVAPERAGTVVKRLMRKDMWSGWGIRTLSADHPSFNPYNYQTGAVWPHDNSLIALGMRRYGFAAESAALARDISGAASHFLLNQLPELYGGLQRDPTSFPVQYLGANVPQAWAAGTPFMLLQAMLGLRQDAPRGKLYVDPALPDWLPDVTLTDLRLGRRRFDIHFWRDGKGTFFKVLTGKRDAVERQSVALSASVVGE